MAIAHTFAARELGFQLRSQLPPERFSVIVDQGLVKRPETRGRYIPDVYVVPVEHV